MTIYVTPPTGNFIIPQRRDNFKWSNAVSTIETRYLTFGLIGRSVVTLFHIEINSNYFRHTMSVNFDRVLIINGISFEANVIRI